MRQLSLYSCQVFNTVVETNSFTKTANLLYLTPSAVSHMITKMESEFGYSLFIRGRNGVRLTENGKMLLPFVRNLLYSCSTLEKEVERIGNSECGVVRVGSFYSVVACWLPIIIQTFNEKHPNIRIVVYQSGDLEVKKWIDNGDVDLAFAAKGFVGDLDSFLPLHSSPLVCVTHKDYIPPNGASMTAEDVKKLPLIFQSDGYDTEPMNYIIKNKICMESNFRIESDDAALALVEAGFGCCIVPKMTVNFSQRSFNIYPLLPTMYRTVGVVTIYPEYMTPAAKLLRQHIYQYIESAGLMNV